MGDNQKNGERIIQKYLAYVFGSVGLILLIVCCDFSTGNYKHLLLPDGHCAFNDVEIYNTLIIPYSFAVLNKIFQIIIFVVYLYAKQKHLGCKKVRGQSEATYKAMQSYL